MARTLFSFNPLTGVENYRHDDPDGKYSAIIETVQPGLEHIADYCREAREANKFKGHGDIAMAYKIPAAMAGRLMAEGKLFDEAYMKKWVKEHPEYSVSGGQKYFAGAELEP